MDRDVLLTIVLRILYALFSLPVLITYFHYTFNYIFYAMSCIFLNGQISLQTSLQTINEKLKYFLR